MSNITLWANNARFLSRFMHFLHGLKTRIRVPFPAPPVYNDWLRGTSLLGELRSDLDQSSPLSIKYIGSL